MNDFLLVALVVLTTISTVALVLIYITLAHDRNNPKVLSPDEFAGCLAILNAIIQNEFDAYDADIFSHKGSITNSNFENYYNDITNKIIEKIPDQFIQNMSSFYTIDGIYSHIARKVKIFLTSKIDGVI